ncbi:ubiquitin-specific protease [Pichia kluyveri]|uniref:ubiquitinyl hydrolase 1 n=1 Tax=Pichia kluyveri TaxID=36015 RepID=A0AAV5R913_PICKL|nr:ubiquitin-specific protease [Pichia kluyveri]
MEMTPKIPDLEIDADDVSDFIDTNKIDDNISKDLQDQNDKSSHPYSSLAIAVDAQEQLNAQNESENSQLDKGHGNGNDINDEIPIETKEPEKVYDFSKAISVKTSDRILDDLRSDPLFLLNNQEGILSSPTIHYASKLSNLANNSVRYSPVFWKTSVPVMAFKESLALDENTTLVTFTGLLVPNTPISNFANSKVYHYSIRVRYQNNRVNVKNTFYGFLDDDLYEDDKFWVENNDILPEGLHISETSMNVLLKSLPHVLDSANFLSKDTETLIRLEIYSSNFSSMDLENFATEEIQSRIAMFNSQTTDGNAFNMINLTPYDCLLKLKSVLLGALKNQESPKSIDLDSTRLSVFLDINLLFDKFFFSLSERDGHNAINPADFQTLGEYAFVYRDLLRRCVLEVVYYIGLTSPHKNEIANLFSSSFNDVFESIGEFDYTEQIKNWNSWNDQFYAEAMLVLSVTPYYKDQLVHHIYETLVSSDPASTPIYFDALTYICTSRYTQDIQYYVTILRGNGMLGFGELKNIFTKFGFPVNDCHSMSTISDDDILNAYQNQLIVASSKYEKNTFRDMLNNIAKYRSSNKLIEYLNTEPYFDVTDAYNLLEIDPKIDDSLLITFYDYKVSENGMNFDPNVARAFYSIVLSRKSVTLMNYIDMNLPQFSSSEISIDDAYNIIGCLQTADDLMIIRIFQERVAKDTGTDFRSLWRALKTIRDHRRSKLLNGYITSGIVNSTLLSVDQSPAGLNNIGNTCYLNSLLQYYFVIKPLREYILGFNEVFHAEDFENDEKYQTRRIGGRTVNLKETERSYQFMYQLRDLYYHLIHTSEKDVTPSKELAYLAFSPISFEVEFEDETEKKIEVAEPVEQLGDDIKAEEAGDTEEKNPEEKQEENKEDAEEKTGNSEDAVINLSDDNTSDDLSIEITGIKDVEKPIVKKSAAGCKISADQFECAFEIGSQQDVTECISNVLIQIESAMRPDLLDENNEQIDMIKKLFYGKTKQRLVPVDSSSKKELVDGNVRTKVESFLNLIVNIGDHPKDIYDALDTFFTQDLIELEDGEVKRSLTILELPKILQIQIQRVQFDRVRLIPVKSNEPIPFEEKLYMDRYLETDDQIIINKREEVFNWRRRVEDLNIRKNEILKVNDQGLNMLDVLQTTHDYLKSLAVQEEGINIEENTINVIEREITKLKEEKVSILKEIEELDNKINLQFSGFNKVGYSIFAIFIHRGEASYGHYFIYIRDFKSNVYRKYNDEIVSEVSIEEIFNFREGNNATPYYLSFIKDELLEEITPLERDIMIQDMLEGLVTEVD